MNLDELQSIRNEERQTDSLQPLPGSFYEEAGAYLAALREEREAVAAERGFDAPEFRRLTDEIDTAEDTIESIYERRVGKVVKAASFAAAGMPADDQGLTDEERALFETLVEDIASNRERVLAVLADEDGPRRETPATDATGEDPGAVDTGDDPGATDRAPGDGASGDTDAPPPEADGSPAHGAGDPDAAERHPTAADPDQPPPERPPDDVPPADGDASSDGGGVAPPDAEPSPSADLDRTTVHITVDVGEILGVDERAYDLSQGDVVTLPEENATPLLERGAAERLE